MKNPPHPGRLVKGSIDKLGLSVADAAVSLGVTCPQLRRVIAGTSALSPELAERLEVVIGSTAETWLRMQAAYDRTASDRVTMTAAKSAVLRTEFARTGADPVVDIIEAPGAPSGLTPRVIHSWLYRQSKSAEAPHWAYVIARLRQMPDRAGPPIPAARKKRSIARNTPDHLPIPDDQREALRGHRARTGIGGAVLLRNATDIPPGLTPAVISQWLSGRILTAIPSHLAWTMERYARAPDASER